MTFVRLTLHLDEAFPHRPKTDSISFCTDVDTNVAATRRENKTPVASSVDVLSRFPTARGKIRKRAASLQRPNNCHIRNSIDIFCGRDSRATRSAHATGLTTLNTIDSKQEIRSKAARATSKCVSIRHRHNIDRTSSLHRHSNVTLQAHCRGLHRSISVHADSCAVGVAQEASVKKSPGASIFTDLTNSKNRDWPIRQTLAAPNSRVSEKAPKYR